MSTLAQQIFAVARTEWRVTWRGLGLRLVMAMLAAPFIPYLLLPRTSFDDGGLQVLTTVAPIFGLLAAFLVVPALRREQRFRIAELAWVRPLDGLAYVAGKILAAVLVVAVLLAELGVLVAITQATAGLPSGTRLLVNVLLVAAPALLLCAALYVALGAVLPHPLLGYVVAIALVVLFALYFSQSMLVLWNPWAIALFYNKTLGFGPDLPLLLANRLFYLGLTLTLGGSAVFLFARRERRALAPRRQARAALAVVTCGLVVVGLAVPRFQAASAAVMLSGPVVAPAAVPLAVRDYRLDLRLDPAAGAEDGVARFIVRNSGKAPVATLPLYLNDGLRIRAATLDGRPATVTSGAQFGRVALAPALTPGRSVAVRVSYAGHFKLLHAQYGSIFHGFQTAGQQVSGLVPAVHQSLLGAGMAMLFRDGDWYPLPWTQGTMSVQPPPLGWRALVLRVPAGVTSVASTPDVQRHGATRVFTWNLGGRLPSAVLAVVPPGYIRVDVAGGSVYAPDGDARALRARYGPYVTALGDMNSFFGRPARPVAVVAMPLGGIGDGATYPVDAAVGATLALVPVGGLDQRLGGTEIRVAQLAPPAPYRAALADLAVAWWADRLPRLAFNPTIVTTGLNGTIDDLPGGYVALTEQTAYADPTGALPAYTGAAVAGRRLGSAYYAHEMVLRRALAAIGRQETNTNHALYNVAYLGRGPLAAQIRTLGLMRRINSFTADVSPALDDLRHAIGAERLRRILIDLSAAGTTPYDSRGVACALDRATGRPAAAWMNRYLPPDQHIKPAGGCR